MSRGPAGWALWRGAAARGAGAVAGTNPKPGASPKLTIRIKAPNRLRTMFPLSSDYVTCQYTAVVYDPQVLMRVRIQVDAAGRELCAEPVNRFEYAGGSKAHLCRSFGSNRRSPTLQPVSMETVSMALWLLDGVRPRRCTENESCLPGGRA